MLHEKTFKREDGSSVKVIVSLYYNDFRKSLEWLYWQKANDGKGKKFYPVSLNINIAQPSEILETKLELWNKLKPV